jgi:hypothetical protein
VLCCVCFVSFNVDSSVFPFLKSTRKEIYNVKKKGKKIIVKSILLNLRVYLRVMFVRLESVSSKERNLFCYKEGKNFSIDFYFVK